MNIRAKIIYYCSQLWLLAILISGFIDALELYYIHSFMFGNFMIFFSIAYLVIIRTIWSERKDAN